jgi:hypothetical protein
VDLGYDLVVAGDNHKTFDVCSQGRTLNRPPCFRALLNPGSLMRMTIDQRDHRPCFYLAVVEEHSDVKYERVYYPVEEDVWETRYLDDLEKNAETEGFLEAIQSMRGSDVGRLDFRQLLLAKARATGEDLHKFVQEIFWTEVKTFSSFIAPFH